MIFSPKLCILNIGKNLRLKSGEGVVVEVLFQKLNLELYFINRYQVFMDVGCSPSEFFTIVEPRNIIRIPSAVIDPFSAVVSSSP